MQSKLRNYVPLFSSAQPRPSQACSHAPSWPSAPPYLSVSSALSSLSPAPSWRVASPPASLTPPLSWFSPAPLFAQPRPFLLDPAKGLGPAAWEGGEGWTRLELWGGAGRRLSYFQLRNLYPGGAGRPCKWLGPVLHSNVQWRQAFKGSAPKTGHLALRGTILRDALSDAGCAPDRPGLASHRPRGLRAPSPEPSECFLPQELVESLSAQRAVCGWE